MFKLLNIKTCFLKSVSKRFDIMIWSTFLVLRGLYKAQSSMHARVKESNNYYQSN